LLENSAINCLAPYTFSYFNSLIKGQSFAENPSFFYYLRILIASTNVTSDRATAVCNAILMMMMMMMKDIGNGDILLSIFNN